MGKMVRRRREATTVTPEQNERLVELKIAVELAESEVNRAQRIYNDKNFLLAKAREERDKANDRANAAMALWRIAAKKYQEFISSALEK